MKITNKDPDFYKIMGPVFGSRLIQRETGDRFYDDDNKDWYISLDNLNNVIAVVSVSNNVIKNIYSKNSDELTRLLKDLYYITESSVVPLIYRDSYIDAGYATTTHDHLKNFIVIQGEISNGAIFI